jgi:hypothetical protein
MRKELRRSLFAAACAGVALAGCGGNSSSSTTTSGVPSPAPSPSPSPTPASAGSYLLVGRAGGSTTAMANIPFADLTGGAGPSPFGLIAIDPANPPPPFTVDTSNPMEAGGTVLPLATVSEYFPNGAGSASGWGTRYWVYAKVTSASSPGLLYAVDLRESTTPPAAPTPVQLTSGTISGMKLCSTAPVVFDNYRSANLSWILFHVLGPDVNCGTLDDQYLAIQLSMGPTSTALSLGQLEPIEATYDGEGTITGYLAINHPPVSNGAPTTAVPLQHLDTNFKVIATPALPNLVGTGLDIAGGDFLSLAVSGSIWLYLDSSGIYALNFSTGAVSPPIVTLGAGDTVNGRAVVDGTKAYVAINNATSGSEIVQIDLTNNAMAAVARDTTLSAIRLVGVTSGALVYFGTTTGGVTNLRSAVKSTLVANSTPLNNALTATQSVDALMGPNNGYASTSPTPVAFVVGDTVFFTVADTAPGSTGFAKQAFYVAINSSGTPGATTAIASNVSAVLGAVAPSPISTSGSANTGALVLTMGSNAASGATAPGGAAFAAGGTPATTASLGLYSATGLPVTTVVGSLGSTALGSGGGPLTEPVYAVALDAGPVQAGMPAMLQLTGTAGGQPAEDMAVYTPTTASSLTQVSGFSQ